MLADAVGQALPGLRAEAEEWMTSTCTIRERTDEYTTDPDTGEVTEVPGAVAYSGKCRVRPMMSRGGGTLEIGGEEAFAFDYLVSLPFDQDGSANVREGMPCRIDSSPDAALVGVQIEVQKVDRGDNITARRLSCNEAN